MQSFRCWVIMVAGFVVVALAFQAAAPWVVSSEGTIGPSIVQSITPWAGLVAVARACLLGLVVALGTSRLLTPIYGMTVLGMGLGWAGLDWASMRTVVFHGRPELMAIDGLGWTVIVLLVGVGTITVGGGVPGVHPDANGRRPDPLRSSAALKQAACALAVLPVVWLVARGDMRGQSLAAVALGGVAAGMVGRMVMPHVQPMLLSAATVLVGTLAAWVLAMTMPAAADQAWVRGTLSALVIPIPLDWAAGALIGVPLGFTFGGWFLKHEDAPATAG